jgi:NADH-quinone oxidoreductase subunit N
MDVNWLLAWPVGIVVVAALFAMMADAFSENKTIVEYIAVIGLAASMVLCVGLWRSNPAPTFGLMDIPGTAQLAADHYSMFLCLLILGVGLATVFLSRGYLERQGIFHGEYYILVLFAIAGMMLMVQATELITMFVALEAFSIALYVLSAFARTRKRSSEAGLKYLLLGAFSSAFFLYGIALIYGAYGTTNLMAIHDKVPAAGILTGYAQATVPIGIGLLLVGMAFKVAAVPFHMWTPDVYEGAPTPITAFMSVATKAAAFGALGRILLTAFPAVHLSWEPLVGALAVASMIVGNFSAVWQTDIKRLLAYSSIAHAGYILIGFVGMSAAGVVGDTAGILFYLAAYGIMNIGAFAVVTYLARTGQEYTQVDDFRGLAYRNTWQAVAMSIFLFSLAGLPPVVGFLGKWVLFSNAIARGQTYLVIIGVLTSVVSAYYYLRVVVAMWMRAPEPHVKPGRVEPGVAFVVAFCAIATILAGLLPARLIDFAGTSRPLEMRYQVAAPAPEAVAQTPPHRALR